MKDQPSIHFESMPLSPQAEVGDPGGGDMPIVYTDDDGEPVRVDLPNSATSPRNYTKEFIAKGQIVNVVPSESDLISTPDDATVPQTFCVLGSSTHVRALKAKVEELAERAKRLEEEKELAKQRAATVDQQLEQYRNELLSLHHTDTATSQASSHHRVHHTEDTFGHAEMAIIDSETEKRERIHFKSRVRKRRRIKKQKIAPAAVEIDPDSFVDCRQFPIDLPRVRQYLHEGILYREEGERKTTWTELFWVTLF